MLDRLPTQNIGDFGQQNLNIDNKGEDDRASVITTDKLKKFNEIYGFENGPATQNVEEDGDELASADQQEEQDQVNALEDPANNGKPKV